MAVLRVCSTEGTTHTCPQRAQIVELKKVRDILKPFENITTIMSAEQTVSASAVI